MSERQKQAEFLKTLLACGDPEVHGDLSDRLKMAERDERCMKRACRLVVVVTMLALAVLGYLKVLKVPDDMSRLSQGVMYFCQALALGSAMCLALFVGLLMWHRALINRLYAEGRKVITFELQHQSSQLTSSVATVIVHDGDTAVYKLRTQAQSGQSAEILSFPRAS